MPDSSQSQLRRHLFDWLKLRLADGRLPFRRIEQHPQVLTGQGVTTPDLVLWINRDSLQAGAMILTPGHVDQRLLEEAAVTAASLGLQRFVTWERRAIHLWSSTVTAQAPLQGWDVPAGSANTAAAVITMGELLLQELKGMAVAAMLPAEQLPATYFANLCRQVLRDVEPSLREMARLKARRGQSDSAVLQLARDKGWLTLWRLLALLQKDRFPPGVRPEHLDRALSYALADLDRSQSRQLVPANGETPLPEAAAVRFHHLAGRLAQLNWQRCQERARDVLAVLYAEAGRDCEVDTTPLAPPPGSHDLLVNHLPLQPLAGATVVAATPCLAGLAVYGSTPPQHTGTQLSSLPADCKPRRIVATLSQEGPPAPDERRRRLAALRQPWPYRRFQLALAAPVWLWDALHVGGMAHPDGEALLTLPANWSQAAGAELLWRSLLERWCLARLVVHADGRQTLHLVGTGHAPEFLELCQPGDTRLLLPVLARNASLVTLATLTQSAPDHEPTSSARRKPPASRVTAQQIAAMVFRDGLPQFPDHYLRRFDVPSLRAYQLPGPLLAGTAFFDRVSLCSSDGTTVETDHPVDAEALLLAARQGRSRIELPTDPTLTTRLIAAYREDLLRLWQALLSECRRHRSGQRHALTLARRLWQEQGLPAPQITEQ